MSIENKYPYTDFHELNLDWIVNKLKSIEESVEDWKAVNEIHFEGSWDITKDYKIWSVVNYDNDGYIAVKIVDKGIDITNREYWKPLIDYEDIVTRVEVLEGDFQALNNDLIALTSDVDTFKDDMYYKAGDTITVSTTASAKKYQVVSGYISGGTKSVAFCINAGKSLKNINNARLTNFTGPIRGIQGYVDGSSTSTNWLDFEGANTTIVINKEANIIYVYYSRTDSFTSATNNTPVVLNCNLTFELEV